MADIDLRAAGSETTIGGAIFLDSANVGSGTGNYNTFLAVGDNDGNESGFNSDDAPPLEASNNDIDHAKTHTVLLATVPITIIDGVEYYEFRVDLNEANSDPNGQISLDAFKIYTSSDGTIDTQAELAAQDLVYDMDADATGGDKTLLLSEVSTGSGTDDYAVLVPVSNFAGQDPATTYMYLYVEMGFKGGDYKVQSGFEEWNLQTAGALTGTKFLDSDDDGVKDAGEGGMSGVTIFIDTDKDGALDDGERSTVTDENGNYSFYGVALGTYQIDEVVPDGYHQTTGAFETATIGSLGQTVTVAPIGNAPNFVPNPSLTIVKSLTNANDAVVDTAGETIEYTITVDNTGNVDLTNVVLDDVFAGGATLVSGDDGDNVLETNETWTYTADYVVTQADLNAGDDLVNVAGVDTDQTARQTDDASSTVDQNPSLNIVKDVVDVIGGTDDGKVDSAGDIIIYKITVENTGNVDLTELVKADPYADEFSIVRLDDEFGDDDDLFEVGETWAFAAAHTVTQEEINSNGDGNGVLENIATAQAKETDEDSDDADVQLVYNPSLTIVKSLTNANDAVVDTAGETIEYTITVDNTGNVDLTNVVLDDVFAGGATYASGDDGDNVLETNETWTYTADYVVTQADLNAGGDLVNVAGVDTDQTARQTDDASSDVDQNPALTIVKSLTNANDAVVDTAGETIEYTITVDNTGNVDLTNVVLDDVFAGGATYASGDDGDNVLETNETWTYTADYVVTQADLNAGGDLVNVAGVDTDQTARQTDDASSDVDQNPALTIVKSLTNANDAVVDTAGETIEYTITVENTGNVDLTNVVLDDVFAGGATYASGDDGDNVLETNETWTYTADYVVTQDDLNDGGDLVNVAVVDTDQTDEQEDDASSEVDQNPSLTIVKSLTNANDAVVDTAGETIEYTITVENTGNVDLTNVVLDDVFAGGATYASGDDGDNVLETNETWTYTADYVVTQADLNDGGDLVNVAGVDTDQTARQTDDASSDVDQNPSLTIVKSLTNANDAVVDTAGETIEYTITVENTGNVDLTNVVLDDVFAGGATYASGDDGDNVLETNETWTYTADYVVTQDDLNDGGDLVNVAVVDTDQTDEQEDDASSEVDQNPSLTILKSLTNANDAVVDTAGETIEYTITVENTGNVDLTNVVLDDVFAGGATYASGDDGDNVLETNETWTYTADYVVTQDDLNDGGDLVNVAVVDTDQTDEQEDDASSEVDQNPSLTILKSLTNANDAVVDTAGETIEYTITVENTGNVDLTNVVLDDVFAGGATYASGDDGDNVLETNETWTYTADYVVTQDDLNDGGDLVNVAVVDTDQTDEQEDDASSEVDQNPSLTILKSLTNANDAVVDTAGETIEYTITVENTGNVDLTNVVLDDVFAGGATYASGDDGDNVLETNETWTYTADYVVTQDDLNDGGDLVNVAVVDTDQTDEQEDDASSEVDQNPSLTILKSLTNANDAVVDTAGETIEYTITVENTGNVDLTNVVLDDVFAGGATYASGDDGDNVLETNETWTYTADYVVTQDDLNDGGDLVNVAVVDTDQTDEQEDDASSEVDQNPSLTILKSLTNANDAVVDTAGETIEYTITVENTGNVDLTNVVLDDVFAGGATYASGDDGDNVLETNETWTYTADYVVTQDDLNDGGDLVNVAVVDTDQTDEQEDDASSEVDQNPSLNIVKTVSGVTGGTADAAGDVITYAITVENTGNVTLTGVTVTDLYATTGPSYVSGDTDSDSELDVDETWTYSATHTVTQAEIDSNGDGDGVLENTATADSNESDEDEDDADVPVVFDPDISIDKTATIADGHADQAGDIINYTVVVQNTGNVTLNNVEVTDSFEGALDVVLTNSDSFDALLHTGNNFDDPNGNGALDVGETWTYTYQHVVTQNELDTRGVDGDDSLDNTATVTTTSPDLGPLEDSASIPILLGPGVRTPGFWSQTNWKKFWDGIEGNEPNQSGTNGFADGEITYQVDSNGDDVIDAAKGLLIGDFDLNGIENGGENAFFISTADALTLLSANQKQVQNAEYQEGRALVATWLNYLAGNPVTAADPTDVDAKDAIQWAVDWMLKTTQQTDGNITLADMNSHPVTASSAAWTVGIDGPDGGTTPTAYASIPQYDAALDIPGGAQILGVLDEYNNHGTVYGTVIATA